MPTTLTASSALAIQMRAQDIFNLDKTQAFNQYANPAPTATILLARNGLRFAPIFTNANRCVELKVWRPDLTDLMTDTLYSGTVPDASATCTLAAGARIGSLSQTISPNVYIAERFSIDDDLCNNDFDFANQVALSLNAIMTRMRSELNRRGILFLNANAGANVATGDATENTWTIAGGNTTIPKAQWETADILMKLNIAAAKNRLPEGFLIVDGTNLLLQSELAPYLGLNGDGRSTGALYKDLARNYTADMLNLSAVVGSNSTFLVNPNMVGFYNRSKYTSSPIMLDAANNTQAFSVQDPELMYRRVLLNESGTQRGSAEMVPVTYDVLYQKVCTDRDSGGRLTFNHTWEVMFEGAYILGPTGVSPQNTTGILKFIKGA